MLVLALTWIAFGLLVALMAQAILPSRQPLVLLSTALIGIAGAFIGSLAGNLLSGVHVLEVHPAGFIGSVIGSLAALALIGARHRHAAT